MKYKKPTNKQAVEFIRESNAIEQIHHSLDWVEKGWREKRHNEPSIHGHVNAFNDMLTKMFTEEFTEIKPVDISKLHTTLMTDLLAPYELGFRRGWVQVGGRVCPPPIAVSPMLKKWCKKVNELKDPEEWDVLEAHLAYEYIHPFNDGNGRSGRLIWLWLRYKFGFGYKCFFNSTKTFEYYPLFDTFNWDDWLENK